MLGIDIQQIFYCNIGVFTLHSGVLQPILSS